MLCEGLWSPFSPILHANTKSDTQCVPHSMHAAVVSLVAMCYKASWQKKDLLKLAQVVRKEICLAQGLYLHTGIEQAV